MKPCFFGPMPASSGFIIATLLSTLAWSNCSARICSRVHTLLPSSKTPISMNLSPGSRPPCSAHQMCGGFAFVRDDDELEKHLFRINKLVVVLRDDRVQNVSKSFEPTFAIDCCAMAIVGDCQTPSNALSSLLVINSTRRRTAS